MSSMSSALALLRLAPLIFGKVRPIMPRLIPVPATPDFEDRLRSEIAGQLKTVEIENLRADLRAAVTAVQAAKPKPRHRSSGKRPSVRLSNYASLIHKSGS